MSQYTIVNGIVWELDPLGKYVGMSPMEYKESLGLIPSFFSLRELRGKSTEEAVVIVLGHYGNPSPPMRGAVGRDGTYVYPGGLPLHPLAYADIWSIRVNIYPYGITSLIGRDKTVIMRLD